MHLGNIYAALMSWLDARANGGRWILRIEDLDPQRSRSEYARMIEEDLRWLGLDWDEGGMDSKGSHGPYRQSLRDSFYNEALEHLRSMGLTYPCRCRRADIMATQAPHQSDGRIVYSGTCRPCAAPPFPASDAAGAVRLYVPDRDIEFTDAVYGPQRCNLARHCGDFVLRRADGAWAYQLAVVVDDALMGVNRIVRGNDLLLSAAQQNYLFDLLGFPIPQYAHLPLLVNNEGRRLSKRDASLSMEALRMQYSPRELLGHLAHIAGLTPAPEPISLTDMIPLYHLPEPIYSITV